MMTSKEILAMQEKLVEALAKKGDIDTLEKMLKKISKELGVSEHFKWGVEWVVSKFNTEEFKRLGSELAVPFEKTVVRENIVLDLGAEELLKLLGGITGANAYSNANARIYVGSSELAENPSQTGVQTPLGNAPMDVGYPQVTGRSIVFRATFSEDEAVGDWREVSIVNGSGVGAVALNRKQQNMGTKASGMTFVLQSTISIISV